MPNTVKSFNAEEERRLMKENLRVVILDLVKVSTIPSIMKRVMEVADDPMAGVGDLEKVIENDPAIASRVVAVSNAVFYGFPRKINSISQAILVLGFEMVKGLAISTTVFNASHPGASRQLADIWGHSFKCAMASVLLARKTGLLTKESAFLAGLLHDIGKPLMAQACGERYLEAIGCDGFSTADEEDEFGTCHAEAGAWFADKCKLPEECVAAIRYHHGPSEVITGESVPAIVTVTYLADIIASSGPLPAEKEPERERLLEAVGLTDQDFKSVCAEFSALNVSAPSFA